jgi:hypothetical protein
MPAILGLMVTRSGHWMVRPWLERHHALFERLAVLDGSPPGSVDQAWTSAQCARFPNVAYATEANLSSMKLTDQTARALAMQLLLRPSGGSADAQLSGRWILNCHPDEFYLMDPRALAATVAVRDSRATCVLFGAAYVMPTRAEYEAIVAQHSDPRSGHELFHPIGALNVCDAEYKFKEPRLWRYVSGTRWGTRHSITTPETHPGHRTWPTAREVKLGISPFFVHFKLHSFGPNDLIIKDGPQANGALGGSPSATRRRTQTPWIAFNNSGFATGIAPHRTHGRLRIDPSRSARDTVLAYYELSGRPQTTLRTELRRRCARQVPRCSVPWTAGARFA